MVARSEQKLDLAKVQVLMKILKFRILKEYS